MTATNGQGTITATVPVTVTTTTGSPPAITYFHADHYSITSGGQAYLTWQINGATSITIEPGVDTSGATYGVYVSPTETTIYTMTAFNGAGSDTETLTITVTP
jgi:hypothetical protein